MIRPAITAAVLLLVTGHGAFAQTIGGPETPLAELAQQVVDEAVLFGISGAGIGLACLAFGLIMNINIERIAHYLVAGAILASGLTAGSMVLGAELVP